MERMKAVFDITDSVIKSVFRHKISVMNSIKSVNWFSLVLIMPDFISVMNLVMAVNWKSRLIKSDVKWLVNWKKTAS